MKKITLLLSFIGAFSFIGQAQIISNFPHTEDFETFAQCGGSCTSICGLQDGWTNPGQRDFSSDVSGTSSNPTGPNANGGADHNPGIAGGRYLYAETSSPCYSGVNQWELVSPQIDLAVANAVQFEFWYHMYGSTMGLAHVDVTNDGGLTWDLDVIPAWTDNQDIWQMNSVDLATYSGDTVNVRIRYNNSSSYYGDFAFDDVKIYDLLSLDAGIAVIDSPSVPACNVGNDVWATINNYGTDTLTSVIVAWEVDGVGQVPFNYTGNLVYLNDTTLKIGTSSIPIISGSTIKAWTASPNGGLEMANGAGNDTTFSNVILGLNGLYTIGGLNPDFSTIDSARIALEAYGICGPTVFDLRAGTYNEQVTFGPVANTSSVNTITFKSEDNNKDSVLWTYALTGSTSNWVVNLDDGDYFTFDMLTIENTNGSYGRVVNLTNSASWNTFSNNCLLGDTTPTSTSTFMAVIFSQGSASLDENNTFDNNVIWGGSYAAYWYGGNTSTLEAGNTFKNNWFKNQYYYGARFYYQDNFTFNYNRVSTNTFYTGTSYATYFYYCDNATSIVGNQISGSLSGTTGGKYGIYMGYCDASSLNQGLVANNMINVGFTGNTGTHYGIYFNQSGYQNVLNNNILVEDGSTNARAIYGNGGGANTLMNNNLVNTGAGYALYITSSFSFTTIDYNNIYCPTGNYAYYNSSARANLAALQAEGIEANGVSVDPMYFSSTDLHTCTDSIDGKGMVSALVSNDFDGDPRSASTPDIGADEFASMANYSIGDDVVLCPGDSVQLFAGGSPTDSIYWSTGDTVNTIWVNTAGSYWSTVNGVCGNATDTMDVTMATLTPSFTHVETFLTSSFTNTTTGSPSGFTYMWNFGDGNTSTVTNPIHVYATAGSYTVTLYATGPCGTDSVSATVVGAVGIDELVVGGEFTIFPNPATNNINIAVQLLETGTASVLITDIAGRVIATETLGQLNTGKSIIPVNISDLSNGSYFVKLKVNETVYTQKLSVFK